jgi:hypothetical protein
MRIDTDADHIDRAIDMRHLFEMVQKARTHDDGTIVSHPVFESRFDGAGGHTNCICGHAIVYNYIATCKQTNKSFVVGSDCIETVCKKNKWEHTRMCCYCETSESLKTQNNCKECSTALRHCGVTMKTGKHAGSTFYEIYETNEDYIKWVCKQDKLSPALQKLVTWHEHVKAYHAILEEYENSMDFSEFERIAYIKSSKIVPKKPMSQITVRARKVYFKVNFSEKDDAKALGMKWDPDCKCWYTKDDDAFSEASKRFIIYDDKTQERYRAPSGKRFESLISHE